MLRKMLYGLLITSLISSFAIAGGPEIVPPPAPHLRPFIGINYIYLHQSNTNTTTDFIQNSFLTFSPAGAFPNNFSGYELEFGLKYGQYIAFAWGYHEFGRKSKTTGPATLTVTEKPKGFYFDFRGYWPIYNFDLIGLIGSDITSWGGATITTLAGTSTLNQDDQINIHFGGGADFWFTPNWAVQALFKYTPTSSQYVRHFWTISAGLYYMFN